MQQSSWPVIEANLLQKKRASAVSWQVLQQFCDYADLLSDVIQKRARGDMDGSDAAFDRLVDEFSRREIYIERSFDLYLTVYSLNRIFKKKV